MGKPVKTPELLISAVSFCFPVLIKKLLAPLIKAGYLFKSVKNSKSQQVWLLFWDTDSQESRAWKASLEII